MSKCCKCKCKGGCGCGNMQGPGYGPAYGLGCGTGCGNFPQLIILILILLQFTGKNKCVDICDGEHHGIVGGIDKGIIFIIALYYLSCCSPCGKRY